ncbi:LOW QUALITY PROTEIN: ovostatin-like [Liasis olivaceus]
MVLFLGFHRQYLLVVSSVLHGDAPNTACIHLFNFNESVNLNAVLEYGGQNTSILTEHGIGQNFFKCHSFLIPSASSNPLAFILMSIKGAYNNVLVRRAVAIQNRGSIVFIQTDKPIYKSGQKVLFRVVALDTHFKPVPEIYPLITIQARWRLCGPEQVGYQCKTGCLPAVRGKAQACCSNFFGAARSIGAAAARPEKELRSCAAPVQPAPGQRQAIFVAAVKLRRRACTGLLVSREPGVLDPQRNRIFQWINVTSEVNIVQLFFTLVLEPILGIYQITVQKKSGTRISHSFTVDEYVLPKFDVIISAPKTVSVENPDFKVKVCSVYTYGQPVEGNVQLSVCRNINFYGTCKKDPVCESVNKKLGKDGCLSHIFSSKTFELNRSGYWMNLDVKAIVTEKGTGVQSDCLASISISRVLGTVTFENMEQNYRRGISYCGQLKLVDVDNSPIANEVVQLLLNSKNVGNYSTSANGMAQFCIDTSEILSPDFSLRLIYKPNENCNSDGWIIPYYPEAYYSVQRFYSRTESFIKIQQVFEDLHCDQFRLIKVFYILNNIPNSPQNLKGRRTATFYYLVLVKNKIVHFNKYTVSLSHASKGSFNIRLKVSSSLAPVATLLVYTLHPEREVVADTAKFQIEKCFKNKVKLQFSEKQALPASKVRLHIKAADSSYCALRAVDQSVLLLKPETELSAESVYSLLPYDMFGYYFNGLNLEDDPEEPCLPSDNIFYNGLFYVPAAISYGPDAYELIRNTDIKFVTNSRIRQPVLCSSRHFPSSFSLETVGRFSTTTAGPSFAEPVPPPPPSPGDATGDHVIVETIRKLLPETWIWDIIPVNSTGHADLTYVVPDTITEWKANAFCVAQETGFGISEPASLIAFQPFFVDLTLPYSIIRGEDFLLKAVIFNYLDRCIQVTASLAQSLDFQAQLISPAGDDKDCVCGNERKTYIWNIITKKLGDVVFSVTAEAPQTSTACGNGTSGGLDVGRKDTLIRTLLVEPEGVEKEVTQSLFVCPKGAMVSEPVSLKLPENLVEGSARSSFSCIGDLMGTAMHNLQQLLQMPYGCGEQNMALFAPNIYILEYLNATRQLTEEIKSKATEYLVTGYQTQLSYRHPDGSYSAFGSRDKEGNTWLTAFVFKNFARSSHRIFIDPDVQTQSFIWLTGKQRSDGCFQNVGKLFNNALKGGIQDELSLAAYITSALLESGLPTSHSVVNALYCLEAGLEKGNITIYDQALLTYAFGLAGNKLKLDLLLDKLMESVKKEGGSLHWERDDRPPAEQSPSFYPRASSAEVEMTSYVLLALLTLPNITPEQMTISSQIVQWMSQQQNPNGGFSTTQDMVVAIQALAQFSQLTFSEDGQNSVKIHSNKPFEKVFEVANINRLLLQQTSLPDVPGEYLVDVNGSGCVFIQTTLRYNINLAQKSSGFFLSVHTANASCAGSFQTTFAINISARYTGKRNHSNMAIIDAKMLTGFLPDQSSLQKTHALPNVMKVEIKNHVLFYLDELSDKEISFSFIIVQDLNVANLRPASVRIYDYYETDETSFAEYESPCTPGVP